VSMDIHQARQDEPRAQIDRGLRGFGTVRSRQNIGDPPISADLDEAVRLMSCPARCPRADDPRAKGEGRPLRQLRTHGPRC
jgi:hypothetical protein